MTEASMIGLLVATVSFGAVEFDGHLGFLLGGVLLVYHK